MAIHPFARQKGNKVCVGEKRGRRGLQDERAEWVEGGCVVRWLGVWGCVKKDGWKASLKLRLGIKQPRMGFGDISNRARSNQQVLDCFN